MLNENSENKGLPMMSDDGDFINISTVEHQKQFDQNSEATKYPEVWARNIFNELNKEGFSNPKAKNQTWESKYFENNIDLIKGVITYSNSIYEHLNKKGLVNKGLCPITGEDINNDYFYEFYGRKVFISSIAKELMKEWDRNQHLELFGKEPTSHFQKIKATQDQIQEGGEKKKGRLMLIMWAILIVLLLFKFFIWNA